MTFLAPNQTILVLTALPPLGSRSGMARFFDQTEHFGSEFETAEEWLCAWNCDLDNVEAVYRLDLSMSAAPVNVSEAVAVAWLDLNPYARPADFPPIVENSTAARPSRLVLDRDGAADLANDMQRDREVA
jgi:hypothetical protein